MEAKSLDEDQTDMTADRPNGRATSHDVAKKAGVSRATVSYVVNGVPGKVTTETRERVLAAAADLGYTQYGPGRTLKSGVSDIVLFVLNDLPVGHALNTLLDELEAKLAEHSLSLVLFRVSEHGNSVSRVWREIGPCAVLGLDAITDADAREMRDAELDVFRLDLQAGGQTGDLIQSQTDVGQAQVRFLAERGHEHLGYAYPEDPRVTHFASLRLQGAVAACQELGLAPLDIRTVPLDLPEATGAVEPWTTAGSPVTAVCAYNDGIAFALLAAIRENGMSVPDDLAVIGVDNDPIGQLLSPSLTTIDTRHVQVADELARLVIESRRGGSPSIRPIPQRYEVIVRGSAP
jgi:DNA-binding LacI/PurR family transcriptional regulator